MSRHAGRCSGVRFVWRSGGRAAGGRIREIQQGLGRPVIAAREDDHRVVAVGNSVHRSKTWKTFPDFLADYIKKEVGPEWGIAEMAKPLAERHPLMQWSDAFCRYQETTIKTPGEVHSAEITGVVACYLGVAYALYLLDHNVELRRGSAGAAPAGRRRRDRRRARWRRGRRPNGRAIAAAIALLGGVGGGLAPAGLVQDLGLVLVSIS